MHSAQFGGYFQDTFVLFRRMGCGRLVHASHSLIRNADRLAAPQHDSRTWADFVPTSTQPLLLAYGDRAMHAPTARGTGTQSPLRGLAFGQEGGGDATDRFGLGMGSA